MGYGGLKSKPDFLVAIMLIEGSDDRIALFFLKFTLGTTSKILGLTKEDKS
jgi:hypothetical protein